MKDTRGEKKVDVITSVYKRVSPCKIFSSFIWLGGTIVYFVCFGLTHALCVSRYYRNDLLERGNWKIYRYTDAGRSTYVWHILSRGRDELDRIFHTRRNLWPCRRTRAAVSDCTRHRTASPAAAPSLKTDKIDKHARLSTTFLDE